MSTWDRALWFTEVKAVWTKLLIANFQGTYYSLLPGQSQSARNCYQEITRNTSFTLLKYQNGRFNIMSVNSCNLKSVVISHIYTLFQCCLFNLSAFREVILEFWWKNRSVRKYAAATICRVSNSRLNIFKTIGPFSKVLCLLNSPRKKL